MTKRESKQSPKTTPMTMDRHPDRYLSTGTPCWDLPDGRTVVGQSRRQIILMPATYVPVPPDEVEQWEREIVDCLADILIHALERRAAEEVGHLTRTSTSPEGAEVRYPIPLPSHGHRGTDVRVSAAEAERNSC